MGLLDIDNNINIGRPPFDVIAERAIEVLKPNEMFGPGVPEEIPYDIKDELVWFYVLCLRKDIEIPYNEFIAAYNISISGNLPYSRFIKLSDFKIPTGTHINILDTVIDSEHLDFSKLSAIVLSGCEFENYYTHIKVSPQLKYIRFDDCRVKDWNGFYDYNIIIDGLEPEDYKIHYGGSKSLFISTNEDTWEF